MSSFFKNSFLVLSLFTVIPAYSESKTTSPVLEFIKDESVLAGILSSTICYLFIKNIGTSTFDVYHKIGLKQESDGQKNIVTSEEKRIADTIKEIKETLKRNKGKEPLFVACIANFLGPIATFKKGNEYGIVLGGGTSDLLFNLRGTTKKAPIKARECLINHEFSHFAHNDVHKRLILASMAPFYVYSTWGGMRLSGKSKISSGIASLVVFLLHNYICGAQSRMHESRSDREASQDPEVLEACADWFEKTWDPFEKKESKKNIHNLCEKLNLTCIENKVATFLQWFRTHPTNDQRIKDFRAHAAQLRKNQLNKKRLAI